MKVVNCPASTTNVTNICYCHARESLPATPGNRFIDLLCTRSDGLATDYERQTLSTPILPMLWSTISTLQDSSYAAQRLLTTSGFVLATMHGLLMMRDNASVALAKLHHSSSMLQQHVRVNFFGADGARRVRVIEKSRSCSHTATVSRSTRLSLGGKLMRNGRRGQKRRFFHCQCTRAARISNSCLRQSLPSSSVRLEATLPY